ncbi:hypothetical protein RUM44_004162 [Polyplax serrata]|uniref:Carboxylesterase type B domain-containing protein n=1 Tax=Polyplax serrata TaxID=468196 RepID=A0ABR1B230_POLSC
MVKTEMCHTTTRIAIVTVVLVQFQVSVVCNLHGFSPQNRMFRNEMSANGSRVDGDWLYNSYSNANKFYESIKHLSGTGELLTREIRVKQGRLKGVVREFRNPKLKNVETFLGIPYAAPPVKALRFMPPGSPPSWKDLKVFNTFGPVCPQRPPDLNREPLKTMNVGQYNRLKGLMPFLTNQSEDCLYLNIYAPEQDSKYQAKYPVLVYIHGESFEWNSGNPYDGSVLASYGNVLVVTINFRLGILGFLKPGISEHTVSNFGLLDQIAALQWIKENIEEFGGDPSKVTLMGHGTGAACINFLMVSPVSMASEGLFHKAILMSGTALSDWAVTRNPLQYTIQVAEALNCPLVEENDELSNCLRRKRLSEIMSVKINVPEFQTPFGPIVDGSVVPNTPEQLMGVYQTLFTRYDLLYGITQWETYHSLDPVSLTYGMLEAERNELLKKYMYYKFEALPYFALATTLSAYLNWSQPSSVKSAAEEHRDLVLNVLTDARYTAPVIRMAQYHSKLNPKSYLYVFGHKSTMGEFAGSERSISGEEIAYVLGSPLLNEETPLSDHKFNLPEQLLCEYILTYFTNFVKTGNPNAPRRVEYMTLGPKEWQEYDVYWPEYDPKVQSYVTLDIPPHLGHRYRAQMTQFWNKILPDLLKNPTRTRTQTPDISMPLQPRTMRPSEDRNTWTYGTVRVSPNEYQRDKKPFKVPEEENESLLTKLMDYPLEEGKANAENSETHFTWVIYLVAIAFCLLLVNGIIVVYYFRRKKEETNKSIRIVRPRNVSDAGFEERLNGVDRFYPSRENSETGTATGGDTKASSNTIGKLKKVWTNSTEGPTKVKKWIQLEILAKCSKENKRIDRSGSSRTKTLPNKSTETSHTSSGVSPVNSILKNNRRVCMSQEGLNTPQTVHVKKVSVGIDATPSSRGDSVLKQVPIELTKSLDQGIVKIPSDDVESGADEEPKLVRRSRTSISLQVLPTVENEIKFVSSSKPEIIKLLRKPNINKNNFVTFGSKQDRDVNVTSRESDIISEGTHVDPLENIQKRNFPKVLPDFPEIKAMKRLSFPQSALLNIVESNRNKLHLPPPPPPPRISTLQRKDKQNFENHENESKFLTFSTLSLKTPEKKGEDQPVGTSTDTSREPKPGNCATSTASSNKSDAAVENRSDSDKGNKKPGKREVPNIIIQPKIGPKKSEMNVNKQQGKKARINLQAVVSDKSKNSPNPQLDTKGPSEKRKGPIKGK